MGLIEMEMVDSLTGLLNRIATLSEIDELLIEEGSEPVTLVLLDIGRFRKVNDSVGIQIGDRIIRIVSKRIKNAAPEAHVLGRTSGDNFALAFKGLSQDQLDDITDKLLDFIKRPIAVGGNVIIVSLAIGIATSQPADGKDAASLFHAADIALHHAQRNKLEVTHFEPHMLELAQAAHSLENDLRVSLATHTPELHQAINNEQFSIHYQPIISSSNYAIAGFEALIRWNHPQRGWVSPGQFIPIAEEIGVIDMLGTWVMRKACKDIMQWHGPQLAEDFFISVNVSAKQFKKPALLADTINNALEESRLAPHRLHLEMTETSTFNEIPEKFFAVKETGCKLSLDDFGTGYSSLTYLHSLPFDSVKLDKSFISDLYVRDEARWSLSEKMIRAIFSLSSAIGLELIVEGIETQPQLHFLHKLGCNPMYQGYLFSRPIPTDQIPDFLSTPLHLGDLHEQPNIQHCLL
ncbi:putative bifunctional diguanylate cyclase/phosphodiesterase [Leptothoe kymatousa]|uniref:Bifunctional diguanylate cyclase/phosphodiesterase n=1 Tax=Leptothoe kymatousa TAU-MAC 1615 TaxID=2364775 RepID=A0ABS5Y529_9CYAN|nr:bifunctional diguanylate cyclase/phosphodiesterase [Leptothoe kymatousa]MBT9312922.1 bifunctional diguanylate cyclase/phosphodiesterase [Leptothoe kymatousa TAU-MAC 1615]